MRFFNVMTLVICFFTLIPICFAEQFTIYRSDKFNFEISCLDSWEISAPINNSLFSFKKKSTEKPAWLLVNVANFTGDANTFWDEYKSHPEEFLKESNKQFPDAELVSHGAFLLGEEYSRYFTIVFSQKHSGINVEMAAMSILCIKDKKLYLITIMTGLQVFPAILDEALLIVRSFKFI